MIKQVEKAMRDGIRRWWRPSAQVSVVASVVVNTIYLPLSKREGVDLVALAALITALAPLFAIRAWEKLKGSE